MGTSIRSGGLPALLLVLILIAPAIAQDPGLDEELLAEPVVGKMVQEIIFRGNLKYDESTLKYSIGTKEGLKLSASRLAEDVSTLLTFFARVTIKTEELPEGVRITFIVEENPVTTSLVFRGFTALTSDDLRAAIGTREGYPFAKFKVEQDRIHLTEMLKKKGYYFAEVKAASGVYGDGRQVVFTGIEGPEVDVEEIRFIGNASIEADQLLERMILDESGFLSSTTFVQRTLDQDIISVVQFYRSEGFLDAVVDLRELAFSEDKEDVIITIEVQENQPYLLSEVRLAGGEDFPGDRTVLHDLIGIEPGMIRRDLALLEARNSLRTYYLENAYYNAKVSVSTVEDSLTHTSVATFTISEASPVSVGRVDITGNSLTRDRVIRRSLTIHPGGPLNSIELDKSISRMEGSGFFEPGSVRARVIDTDDPGVKDVVLSLEEGRTGSVKFSAGISSDLGLMGVIELTKRNFDYTDLPKHWGDAIAGKAFTGGGQTLNLLVSPGTDYSQYRLAFTEPWFLGQYVVSGPSGEIEESPFSFGFDLYHTLFTRFSFDERRTGVQLSTGKVWRVHGLRVDDIFRAGFRFTMENVRIQNVQVDATPTAFLSEGLNRNNKLGLNFGWTAVDFPISPGNGWEADLSYTFGGSFLGGNVNFNKLEARVTNYTTLYTTRAGQRHILEISARAGIADEYGKSDIVPIFERFFAGGLSTVRGFEYGEVGPRASGNPESVVGRELIAESLLTGKGEPTGGQAMVLLKAEYGFPIYEQFVRGVTFVDSGNVTERWSPRLLETYRVAVGFGVRVKVPFFGPTPIALDFAWPIQKEKGDGLQVFSFTFDQPF